MDVMNSLFQKIARAVMRATAPRHLARDTVFVRTKYVARKMTAQRAGESIRVQYAQTVTAEYGIFWSLYHGEIYISRLHCSETEWWAMLDAIQSTTARAVYINGC
jgi:hypothetical protein